MSRAAKKKKNAKTKVAEVNNADNAENVATQADDEGQMAAADAGDSEESKESKAAEPTEAVEAEESGEDGEFEFSPMEGTDDGDQMSFEAFLDDELGPQQYGEDGQGEPLILPFGESPSQFVQTVLEALAFASPEPLTARRAAEIIRAEGVRVDTQQMRRAFKELVKKWEAADRNLGLGFRLVEAAGGIVFRTDSETGPFVRRLFSEKPQRLSKAALETLSIVAYRQPCTRPQVDEIRGVDSSAPMRKLLELKLVKVLGKSEEIGRPILYGTTKQFLAFFGLKSLRELPTLKEYAEISGEVVDEAADQLGESAANLLELLGGESDGLVSENTESASVAALEDLESAISLAKEAEKETKKAAKAEKTEAVEKEAAQAQTEPNAEPKAQDSQDAKSEATAEGASAPDAEAVPPPEEKIADTNVEQNAGA
jgi:segregation and condensation protein B